MSFIKIDYYDTTTHKVVPKDAVVLTPGDVYYPDWTYTLAVLRDFNTHAMGTRKALADQIEAQAKPPRIPEPGKYGVVRDSEGEEWARVGPNQYTSHEWLNTETFAEGDWDDIRDPKLIREGV